jgi:hypothetical protein
MADPLPKPRVLIDANVLLAGNAFARWPFEVLQHATNGDFQLILSPLVINQARQHLQRRFPQHLARFERLLRDVDYEFISDPTSEEVESNKNHVNQRKNHNLAARKISLSRG